MRNVAFLCKVTQKYASPLLNYERMKLDYSKKPLRYLFRLAWPTKPVKGLLSNQYQKYNCFF